jgi:hypothetical protein
MKFNPTQSLRTTNHFFDSSARSWSAFPREFDGYYQQIASCSTHAKGGARSGATKKEKNREKTRDALPRTQRLSKGLSNAVIPYHLEWSEKSGSYGKDVSVAMRLTLRSSLRSFKMTRVHLSVAIEGFASAQKPYDAPSLQEKYREFVYFAKIIFKC